MGRFARHLFVCTNRRPVGGKPSCGARGGEEVAAALGRAATEAAARGERWAVTETGCLGPCFEGPNVVVYPEGVWYAGVTAGDVAELVREHLEGGRPVARLLHPWTEEDEP